MERGIQTYKKYLISVLFGTDIIFPSHLLCQLLWQINIQINLLQQSRINQRRSVYVERYEHFDFNSTPLAILGKKAVIFETVAQQTPSYENYRQSRWYVCPCMHKHQNYCVFVEATYPEQESNKLDFFPTTCRIPVLTDATRPTASLENLRHESTPYHTNLLTGRHFTPLNITVWKL